MTTFMQREKSTSDKANPYNREKEWDDEGKSGASFTSANDSLAHGAPKKPKVSMIDNGPSHKEDAPEAPVDPEAPEEAKPYKRVAWQKRYNDLKAHHDKTITGLRAEIAEIRANAAASRPQYSPPKNPAELEQFKLENPDLFAVVESIAHMRTTEEQTALKEQVKAMQEKVSYENARAAYAELKALVPDFEEIKTNPDFHEWAEQQPQQIQDWVYNNRSDATLAAQAINLYKANRGMGQAQPPARKPVQPDPSEAVMPGRKKEEPSPQERIWKISEIEALSLEDYEAQAGAIQKALADGRVRQG